MRKHWEGRYFACGMWNAHMPPHAPGEHAPSTSTLQWPSYQHGLLGVQKQGAGQDGTVARAGHISVGVRNRSWTTKLHHGGPPQRAGTYEHDHTRRRCRSRRCNQCPRSKTLHRSTRCMRGHHSRRQFQNRLSARRNKYPILHGRDRRPEKRHNVSAKRDQVSPRPQHYTHVPKAHYAP